VGQRRSAIQREIRQTRPFATPEQEGVLGVLRTADVLRRHLSSLVEPHDITIQQFNVLRILRGAGASGLPTLDVADRMIEQAPGITRLMDRLEAKGLVRRVRCPRDRRQVLGYITPRGLSLLARLDAVVERGDSAALGGLKRGEALKLIRLLDAIRAGHARSQSSNSK
jgi:DNA-binding MarR family transcriptional regulator